MIEVLYAGSGEKAAEFEYEEIPDASVKVLKQRLAQKMHLPRFRLRLLQDDCPLDDYQTFRPQVVQLVILQFCPPDRKQDQDLIVACQRHDDTVLERHLKQPRSPNFHYSHLKVTPLYVAAGEGSLKCVLLLLEAGADKEKGQVETGATPLYIAARNGHLEVVRLLVESGANKDQGKTNGATPLLAAAEKGHLEVVRLLVELGANKDQGTTDKKATPLWVATQNMHLDVASLLIESGADTDDGAASSLVAALKRSLAVTLKLPDF